MKSNDTLHWCFEKIGFQENLVYTPKSIVTNILDKKKRKCKIIWFNQPYWVNVKKTLVRQLLSLIKKIFPKKNKLHKIFNKSNININYSYISDISSITAGHNRSLLQPNITKYGCNYRVKNTCSLQNQCQTSNLIYQTDVQNEVDNDKKIYFGLATTTFKERFRDHQKRF